MAISADGIYSETLRSIFVAKLEELMRKKQAYDSSKENVRQAFSSQTDEAEGIRVLKDGVKTCFKLRSTSGGSIIKDSAVNADLIQVLQNLDRFLEQPRYDLSLSSHQLQIWASTLEQYFEVQSNRYDFALLYAKLVTEWLDLEKKMNKKQANEDVDMSESFEEVESSAKLQSRLAWERTVFEPFETDKAAILDFLRDLFGETTSKKQNEVFKALNNMREEITVFEKELVSSGQFNHETLRWTIKGLLTSNLLSEEKRAVLKDFLNNNVVLSEIADVLNLRMDNLENWTWGATVPVVLQRKVAGHYGIYMQEDLLQAIFLQYVGVKWSVFFKRTFKRFVRSLDTWRTMGSHMTKVEQRKLSYYLGSGRSQSSLNSKRISLWTNRFFMTQLPSSVHSSNLPEDGTEEADIDAYGHTTRTKQTAKIQMPVQAPSQKRRRMYFEEEGEVEDDMEEDVRDEIEGEEESEEDDENDSKQDMIGLKQSILHLLRTDILINTRLHGETAGFRVQFQNWNALLPHSTIAAAAEYLGISSTWIEFFQTFYQAPLGFIDGSTVEAARTRKRGVPGDHPLSDLLGELILFYLDLYINQATDGQKLWRVHDDLWFWSVDEGTCVKAWESITKFAQVMGVSLDLDKAGSVHVQKDKATVSKINPTLPQEKIRWGFLYLDSSSGQWEIDDALVECHAVELRKQLRGKTDSILSWIQAWNAYASTFFTTNFGKPAKCFGTVHTQKALAALEKVQKKLFEYDSSSNVIEYLRDTLQHRFGVMNIPEGYFFFPAELGGLDLRNPFVNLLLTHEGGKEAGDPDVVLDQFEAAEEEEYQKRKERFHSTTRDSGADISWLENGIDKDEFITFEDFIKYREVYPFSFKNDLRCVYEMLLELSPQHAVTATSDITTAMNLMDKGGVIGASSGINGTWWKMTPYWKWITQLYGGEVVKRFGGLNIVDNGVLPIGMVSLFRSDRVRWQS